MKIKKDDIVVVIAGKDKGKEGKVLRTFAGKERVIVEGVNIRTRHFKKTNERAGQKLQYEAPLHVSNVMIIDPKTKKRARVGYSVGKDGKKIRLSKKSGEVLDGKAAKKTASKTTKAPAKTTKAKKESK